LGQLDGLDDQSRGAVWIEGNVLAPDHWAFLSAAFYISESHASGGFCAGSHKRQQFLAQARVVTEGEGSGVGVFLFDFIKGHGAATGCVSPLSCIT